MLRCFNNIKSELPGAIIESRMDSAFFNEEIISIMAQNNMKFTDYNGFGGTIFVDKQRDS